MFIYICIYIYIQRERESDTIVYAVSHDNIHFYDSELALASFPTREPVTRSPEPRMACSNEQALFAQAAVCNNRQAQSSVSSQHVGNNNVDASLGSSLTLMEPHAGVRYHDFMPGSALIRE